MNFEKYKFIANSLQLIQVELESIECKKLSGDSGKIVLNLERKAEPIDSNTATIFLRVTVEFEGDGPFSIVSIHRGICKSSADIVDEKFLEYAYSQTVPLLLPYARECISSTIARMGLPVFSLPTMDIIKSMSANDKLSVEEFTDQE